MDCLRINITQQRNTMKTSSEVTVTLTEDQANAVMAALDLAVKQGGINAASQILPIAVTISEAARGASAPTESDQSALN